MLNEILFSLGSNIGPGEFYLSQAVKKLNDSFRLIKISSLYRSSPVMDTDQNDFLNICALYQTPMNNPLDVLKITQKIETEIGRIKDPLRPKGPRTIDIDVVFFNNLTLTDPELIIPHKEYKNRNFVLIPLEEISSFFKIIVYKNQNRSIIDRNSLEQQVQLIGELNYE